MKLFKELTAVIAGTALLFGGLALILTAELINGQILLGIILMGTGAACFGYLIKDAFKGGERKW